MKSIFAVAVGLILGSIAVPAWAQPGLDLSAGRKITGSVYQSYSGHAYRSNAKNHARVLQHYNATGSVPKAVAEEHAAEVRRNLTAADKALANLEAENKGDKVATDLITEIKKHQADALKACGMVEAECAKHNADGKAVASCCTDMTAHLNAAEEAHTKLMKHLKIEMPSHTPKATK